MMFVKGSFHKFLIQARSQFGTQVVKYRPAIAKHGREFSSLLDYSNFMHGDDNSNICFFPGLQDKHDFSQCRTGKAGDKGNVLP